MITYYAWIKALHIAFMVTWFAGLFYLPRLFIYHVQAGDSDDRARFTVMERRLFVIMTIGALLTLASGLLLVAANPGLLNAGWFHVKIALLVGLAIYHYRCWSWVSRLRDTRETGPTKWLRWFNEIPTVFLLGIVILAVVKPF